MQQVRVNPFSLIFGMVAFFVLVFLLLRFARMLWWLGMLIAPVLIIASLLINKRPVLDHIKMIGDTFWKSPIRGILYAVLSGIGLPFLAVFFLGKSVFINKVSDFLKKPMPSNLFGDNGDFEFFDQPQHQNDAKKDTEYADYEEIETIKK